MQVLPGTFLLPYELEQQLGLINISAVSIIWVWLVGVSHSYEQCHILADHDMQCPLYRGVLYLE